MVSIRVLLGMLSLLGLASVSSAQTFACGGAGYNLASIGDLSVITNGWYWTLNPCRPLTSGPCANTNATACQNGYNATTLQPNSGGAVLNYYNPFVNVVTWTTINGGIMSRAINGGQDSCSLGTSIRTVAVEYLCNATATTAFISGFEEVNQCQYLAQVQTSLVCTAAALGASTAVGLPFNSNTCGGGLFDLSSLDVRDFTFNGGNGNVLTFRPCSPINTTTSGNCPAGTSFCQSNGNGLSAGNGLAQTYTLQTDGVIIQSQDGATCGQGSSNWGWPREANVYLKCNPAATTPIYVNNSFFEGETNSNYPGENPNGATEPAGTEYCHYSVIIQTAAVCTRLAASTSTAVAIPAPLFSCGGAGYDLTLIAAVDMDYQRPSPYLDTFFVNPCRPLTQGPCAGQGASVCTGNLTGGGGYTSNVLAYLQPVYAPIQWSNTTYNGAQAVQSYSQYGDQGCSASANTRSVTVVYYCATPAGGALSKITSVVQVDGCSYTIYVATTVVCSTPLNASTAVGYPFNSNTCGGGLFNLSVLDSKDFQFNTSSTQAYWWRPCSAATSFVCSAANASFCQSSGSSAVNALAVTVGSTQINNNPPLSVTAVNTYTLQSNGLLIQSQDGTYCGTIPRAAATFLVCNTSATTPYLLSYTENGGTIAGYLNNGQAYCHYELVLATNQVCSSAATPSGSPSSSTGGASGRGSSSGGSSSTGSVVVTVGSSSGTVASRPSSSSSSAAVAPVASQSSSSTATPVTTPSSSSTGSQVLPVSFVTSSFSSSSSTGAPASPVSSSSSSSSAALAPITVASGASATSAVSAMLVAVVLAMMALLL